MNEDTLRPDSGFHTTRWTMVMRSRGDAPEAQAALGELCENYWTPVFRFLCREGRNEDQSRELTQEFFSRILGEGGGFAKADPGKGRFRSYLLGALKHFLANQRRDESRLKRGGDAVIESIESGGSETSPGMELPDLSDRSTDAFFDRHWALAVMGRGLIAVQDSLEAAGKTKHYEVLSPWLMGDTEALSQTEAAAELGMTAGAVKVAIHRLRQKFREVIRAEIAETVDTPEEVQEELRYLIEALNAV